MSLIGWLLVFCCSAGALLAVWLARWAKRWHDRLIPERSVLFLGLDNAGKTTLCGKLTTGRIIQAKPTTQPNGDTYETDKYRMHFVDLGGHQQAREMWRTYFASTDAVLYMIDASNVERYGEAVEELQHVYCDFLARGEQVPPFVVILNKDDKLIEEQQANAEATRMDLLARVSGVLDYPSAKHAGAWCVYSCSIIKENDIGLRGAMHALENLLFNPDAMKHDAPDPKAVDTIAEERKSA